jgi:hypothetical protein
VLGDLRQVVKVDQQVLRPILQVLPRCRPLRVLAHPIVDVIGESLVELLEVFRDDKPVPATATWHLRSWAI